MTTCISAIPERLFREPEQMHPLKIGIAHDLRVCVATPPRVLNYVLRRYTHPADRARISYLPEAAHLRRQAVKRSPKHMAAVNRGHALAGTAFRQRERPGGLRRARSATHHERRLPVTWQRILSYLATSAGPQRPVDIGVALGMNNPGGILRRMRERGLVQQVSRGRYDITSEAPTTQASLDS